MGQAWSTSVVVGGLAVGGRYRLVVTATGSGAAAMSAPVTVLPDARPNPPPELALAPIPGTDGVRATWTPSPTGLAATGAVVQLYDGLAYLGYVTCQAQCVTAAFRGLPYGRRYTVRVAPTNDAGQGTSSLSNSVDLASSCPSAETCVTVDATASVGPARQRAQGFLNSLYPVGDMVARLRALAPKWYRGAPTDQAGAGTLDWSSWDIAVAAGAQTTLVLSNLWHAETSTGGGARPPWADWGTYAAWITTTVRAVEASGHQVRYWEIQNEPGSPSYLDPSDWAVSTVAESLQQFSVAYRAIKAADPGAQIVGPSLSHFADYPSEYNPHEPDLVTFLDYAAQQGLQLAAVSWHEIDNDLGSQPRDFNRLPEMIDDHVAEARQLLAERPALGHPQLWVNEYGRQRDYTIAGWALGDVAAIERSGVDQAGRSCWPEAGDDGVFADDCARPTLDALLEPDGSTPRADYWVYATYARMAGQLVATSSSDAAVSVLASSDVAATRDAAAGVAASGIVAMIGRHVTCLPGVNPSCPLPTAGSSVSAAPLVPAPVTVVVGVRVPWPAGTAQVTIAQVPAGEAPVPVPPTIFQGPVPIRASLLQLSLPRVADGEVYLITIRR